MSLSESRFYCFHFILWDTLASGFESNLTWCSQCKMLFNHLKIKNLDACLLYCLRYRFLQKLNQNLSSSDFIRLLVQQAIELIYYKEWIISRHLNSNFKNMDEYLINNLISPSNIHSSSNGWEMFAELLHNPEEESYISLSLSPTENDISGKKPSSSTFSGRTNIANNLIFNCFNSTSLWNKIKQHTINF